MTQSEYHEYLQSDRWRRKRKGALRRGKHKCRACEADRELQVHHKTYEHVGEEWPDDLEVLCVICHMKEHDKLERKSIGGVVHIRSALLGGFDEIEKVFHNGNR